MSGHASSSVQANAKNNEGEWMKDRIKKEMTEIMSSMMAKSMEEMRMMMERMMAKKDKHSKVSNKERSRRKYLHYQREEGKCSNSYPPLPKHDHKYRTPTYSNKPKVDLLPFYEKENVEKYLD